jgi:hypothetical protein
MASLLARKHAVNVSSPYSILTDDETGDVAMGEYPD